MPEPLSTLEAVLWTLLEGYLEDDADDLAAGKAERIRRLIRGTLQTTDSPSSRDPFEMADWICSNCSSGSRAAAERWLGSLNEREVADLQLGDVLSALAPGLEGDIHDSAHENERRDE